MEFIGWNTLLFVSKWIFIGLIYLALFVVLIAVRREMALRIRPEQAPAAPEPGHLQVLAAGSDTHLRRGEILALKAETRLGADPDNDVVLQDRYVSGRHARLRWDGSAWSIEDLGSRNGTFVDRRRCEAHMPQAVAEGATIQIGDTTFKLVG